MRRSFHSAAIATALLVGGGTFATIAAGSVPAAFAQTQPSSPPAGGQAAGPSPAPGDAGAPPPAPGEHGHRMGQLLMSLNLSDAQKTQIRAIMADAHKQNQNVTDPDQRHANMKAAMAKVETVLTAAQRTELHAKMDAMRQQNQTKPQ